MLRMINAPSAISGRLTLSAAGIERDEHVRRVAGGRDRPRAEVDLIGRHAERRAGRRADLRRDNRGTSRNRCRRARSPRRTAFPSTGRRRRSRRRNGSLLTAIPCCCSSPHAAARSRSCSTQREIRLACNPSGAVTPTREITQSEASHAPCIGRAADRTAPRNPKRLVRNMPHGASDRVL